MRTCFIKAANTSVLVVLLLLSCTKEAQIPECYTEHSEQEVILEATIASAGPETKTVRQSNGSVFWSPGDAISLFYGSGDNGGNKFTALCTEPVAVTNFTGNIGVITGGGEISMDQTYFWGVYPYSDSTSCNGSSITTILPAQQKTAAGSFGNGQFPTLGRSLGLTMSFYNICGGIKFTVVNEGIRSVEFRNLNGESIAGKLNVGFDQSGLPQLNGISDGSNTIVVTPEEGNTFVPGMEYYVVIPPVTMSSGLEVTYKTLTEKATKTILSSIPITRSMFSILRGKDEGLTFVDNGTDPLEENIVFADPAAKFACVAKFDTDGDGEVSINEAEAATSFDGLFTDWKGVKSFDEISYFKNVHSISGLFNGCTKLVSITIPENITDLGTYAFNGCASLTSVILPPDIASIGDFTFDGCSKLASVEIPSKVCTIGRYAFSGCSSIRLIELPSCVTSLGCGSFQNCSSLQSINIPASVKTISEYAFTECSSLTQIVIPDGVTSLGMYAFRDCTSLTSANIPSGISSIPSYCFQNCSSLKSVSVQPGVTRVGNEAFKGVKMWSLQLPASVNTLWSNCFGDISCVILPSTSPVSIQSDSFSGVKGIFVPTNMVEIYKVRTYWLNYSGKIHPLSSYKEKDAFSLVTSGAVDMGTSVKWAACNLGADKPEECGEYYQWAGLQDVTSAGIFLDRNNCPYHTGSSDSFGWTKYIPSEMSSFWSGSGSPDNKTVLDSEDDVAIVKLGGSWRMPTREEFDELISSCNWEWTDYEGINGYMVYGIGSGNKLFLPAAGYRVWGSLSNAGTYGYYWSSSLNTDCPSSAYGMYFNLCLNLDEVYTFINGRHYGQPVRPVCE